MKLSIIVPTKNAEKFLEGLLLSIFSQDTHHLYEVIIVDDFSTDNTIEIANKFNVRVIEKSTTIYSAQNEGIRQSHGDYLYFIGADDILVPGAINNMFEIESLLIKGLVYHELPFPVTSKYQQSYVYSKELFNTYGLFGTEHPVYSDIWYKKMLTANHIVESFIKKPFAKVAPGGFSTKALDLM